MEKIVRKSYVPPCIDVEEFVLEFAILGSSFGTQSLNSEDVDEDE